MQHTQDVVSERCGRCKSNEFPSSHSHLFFHCPVWIVGPQHGIPFDVNNAMIQKPINCFRMQWTSPSQPMAGRTSKFPTNKHSSPMPANWLIWMVYWHDWRNKTIVCWSIHKWHGSLIYLRYDRIQPVFLLWIVKLISDFANRNTCGIANTDTCVWMVRVKYLRVVTWSPTFKVVKIFSYFCCRQEPVGWASIWPQPIQ